MDQQTPTNFESPENQPKKGMAVASLVLGLLAMTLPIAVLDIVLGVIGIVLSRVAKKSGANGMATAGFVVSIVGTCAALSYTAIVFGWIPNPWAGF